MPLQHLMTSRDLELQLQEVMQTLTHLHKQGGLHFLLATKENKPNSSLKIQHSRIINEYKRQKIINVIKNRDTAITPPLSEGEPDNSICQIKPVLHNLEIIEISRDQYGDLRLIKQYESLFSSLTQIICRAIAKEWIKLVEPKKQAIYPYKNGSSSKPPWWPEKVKHIEPDHLDKAGRLILLTLIIRNPEYDIEKLYEKTNHLNFPSKTFKRVMDEIFYLSCYDRVFFHEESFPSQINLFKHFLDAEIGYLAQQSFGIRVSGPSIPLAAKIVSTNDYCYSLFECEDVLTTIKASHDSTMRTRSNSAKWKVSKSKQVQNHRYVAPQVKVEDVMDFHQELTGSLSFRDAEYSSEHEDELFVNDDNHLSSFGDSF